MRVLFVAAPMVGHVQPLIPLARAFHDAGHDVVFATGPEGMAAARSSCFDVQEVAPDVRILSSFTRVAVRHPVLAVRSANGHDRGTRFVGMLFAGVAARMADDLTALADEWAPDLVVQEPLAGAGGLVAAARGIPVVVVNMTLFDGAALFASASEAATRATARGRTLPSIPPPAVVLNTAPTSLVEQPSGRPMRFVPVAGRDATPPEDLTRAGERPRIIASRSTVADPRPDRLMSNVVAVAAEADVDVVLARPDARVAAGPLPPNVRTTDWLPFPAVFPAAAGVVHHGGAGTVLTALTAGIPQLLVPGSGDRRVNSELVVRRGAGLAVKPGRITARDLEQLASDDALRTGAQQVAEEIAAMPHPAELVDDLVDLAR